MITPICSLDNCACNIKYSSSLCQGTSEYFHPKAKGDCTIETPPSRIRAKGIAKRPGYFHTSKGMARPKLICVPYKMYGSSCNKLGRHGRRDPFQCGQPRKVIKQDGCDSMSCPGTHSLSATPFWWVLDHAFLLSQFHVGTIC